MKQGPTQVNINIHGIEYKLTRFQIYSETEVACKCPKPNTLFRNSGQIRKKLQDENRLIDS